MVLKGSSGGSTESPRGTPLYTGIAETRTEEENRVTSGEDVAKRAELIKCETTATDIFVGVTLMT